VTCKLAKQIACKRKKFLVCTTMLASRPPRPATIFGMELDTHRQSPNSKKPYKPAVSFSAHGSIYQERSKAKEERAY